MKKSLFTKIIIGLIIIIIIIVFGIIVFGNIDRDEPDEVSPLVEDFINETKGKLVKIDNLTDLYMVKTCIQKFYENLCAINYVELYNSNNIEISSNTAIQMTEEGNRNKEYFQNVTYQFLSKEYINKNGITKDNISLYNVKNFENVTIEIYSLYYVSQYENVYAYFANGIIRDSENNDGNNFNYIVVVDKSDNSFEIYLDNYIDNSDFSKLTEGEEINFKIPNSVENREYNTFSYISVKYDQAVQDTFYCIRRLLLYDSEKAYSLLADQMKERYTDYSEFKKFIEENENDIFSLKYGSYKLKSGENGAIFVIYNSDNSMSITVNFDGFSSFKFSIENLK